MLNERQQDLLAGELVNLVDYEHRGKAASLDLAEGQLVILLPVSSLDDKEHELHV